MYSPLNYVFMCFKMPISLFISSSQLVMMVMSLCDSTLHEKVFKEALQLSK